MARETRQQRRARRAEAARDDGGAVVDRGRSRQAQRRPEVEAPTSQTGGRRTPEGGSRRFVFESWAELKKVEWPGQSQVIQATTVVLIACVVVGAFLFVADLAFREAVENILQVG